MSEPDQRVSFMPDAELTPELTNEERTQTFLVKATVGEGDDQFLRLVTLDGDAFGWFRATQLAPAAAPHKEENSPLPAEQPETEKPMPTTKDIEKKAASFAQRVATLSAGRSLRDAISLAVKEDADGAEAYRLAGIGAAVEPEPTIVVSLSARTGETFDQLAMRYALEKGVPLREAVREMGRQHPALAAAH